MKAGFSPRRRPRHDVLLLETDEWRWEVFGQRQDGKKTCSALTYWRPEDLVSWSVILVPIPMIRTRRDGHTIHVIDDG